MTGGKHSATNGQVQWWSGSTLGQSLLATEKNALRAFLPGLRGNVAVQIGSLSGSPLLEACSMPHRFVMLPGPGPQPTNHEEIQYLYADKDHCLPFASGSVDLCLLPHVLDFIDQPHQLLRDVDNILVSGGYMVVLGFNPFSLWGLRGLLPRGNFFPGHARFFSMRRIKDWLSLLDYDVTAGKMMYYRPPTNSELLRDRLFFMENAGDRWWPMLAAVYLLVAQKREAGMTVIDVRQSFKKPAYLNSRQVVAGRSNVVPLRRQRPSCQAQRPLTGGSS